MTGPNSHSPDSQRQKKAFRQEAASRLDLLAEAAERLRQSGRDERRCEKLLDQLMAFRSELDQAVLFILDFHFDRCVRDAIQAGREEEVIRGIKRTMGLIASAQLAGLVAPTEDREAQLETERRAMEISE